MHQYIQLFICDFFQNISFTTYNAQNKCVMDIQGKRQINTYEMVQTKSGVHWLTVSEWNNTNYTQVSWDFCVFLVLKMKWGVFLWFGKSWWDSRRSKLWSTTAEVPFVFEISLQNWSKKRKFGAFVQQHKCISFRLP